MNRHLVLRSILKIMLWIRTVKGIFRIYGEARHQEGYGDVQKLFIVYRQAACVAFSILGLELVPFDEIDEVIYSLFI